MNTCVQTTCPYCGVGCGVRVETSAETISVAGDETHPANLGRLCSKGAALADTIGMEGRLLTPKIGGMEASWDEAIGQIATRFHHVVEEHGPDSVAFYVSGQLLTEDYYVANKLIKGFIGTANIDTNSRLCMASSVAGHKRGFGSDTVPGVYEDLEEADLIVLVGSNLAWCHPVLYQRVVAAKANREEMRLVNIDPRRTASSDAADLSLSLAPGSDVALFNGLLREIEVRGALDHAYIAAHVAGHEAALEEARSWTLERVSAETGLEPANISAFYRAWIGTDKVVTIYSQGVNQSTAGTDKVNAILNCHFATGRIGHPGMGPFSVTGQPNAMGGREVGGLANMLACHLALEEPTHRSAVQRFWDAPTMAAKTGLKAVDLFRACASGKIKALWVMSTNPAVSMPEADMVRDAIDGCDFVVVSDILAETDTAKLADIVLPALAWGEKSGTVTNSERMISRQRPFMPGPKEARADWKIIADVGRAMGWEDAFSFESAADVFREHARLSRVAASIGSDFDISGLAGLSDAEFDALKPVRWPVTNGGCSGPMSAAFRGSERLFGDGTFNTPDGRGRMLPISFRAPVAAPTEDHPFRLNTGRVRDHWHTMTRTARAARLSQHIAEPFVEIHPADARMLGIGPADLAKVSTPHGTILVRALITDRTARGNLFVPMHWTDVYASKGRVDSLIPAEVDPISGQPESKAAVATIERYEPTWYGFAVAREDFLPKTEYWARAKVPGGWQAELACDSAPTDWADFMKALFGNENAVPVGVSDSRANTVRMALVDENGLVGALFVAPEPVSVARKYVVNLLEAPLDLPALLAGRPGAEQKDPGPVVCSCFDVGYNQILDAIAEEGLMSVEAIGNRLNAGTNCGSCRPELRTILQRTQMAEAAE